jgi:predicted DNA-binding protein
MTDPKPFASLSPTLLARKGAAKPAMRPQLQPLNQFQQSAAAVEAIEEDLGWNDMGDPHLEPLHDTHHGLALSPMNAPDNTADECDEDYEDETVSASHDAPVEAEVVPLTPADTSVAAVTPAEKPEVVRQQEAIVHKISRPAKKRTSALAKGRRAAFTLRLDAERHLKLRLASTVTNRSAQQLVTEALDRLIEEMPEIATLASKVRKHG